MTKIKNTKKGMAKKTLSISLAVAMLATSNVPVWAAEDLFTDGEVAVEAFDAEVEAPVVEEVEEVVEAQNVEDPTWASRYTAEYKDLPSSIEWDDEKTVKIRVWDKVNEKYVTDYSQIGVRYLGKDGQLDGDYGNVFPVGAPGADGYGEFEIDFLDWVRANNGLVGNEFRLQVVNTADSTEKGYAQASASFKLEKATLKGKINLMGGNETNWKQVTYTGSKITEGPVCTNPAGIWDEVTTHGEWKERPTESRTIPELLKFEESQEILGENPVDAWNMSKKSLRSVMTIKSDLYRGNVEVTFAIQPKLITNDNFAENIQITLPQNNYEYTGARIEELSSKATVTDLNSGKTCANALTSQNIWLTQGVSPVGECEDVNAWLNPNANSLKNFHFATGFNALKPVTGTYNVIKRDLTNAASTKIYITNVNNESLVNGAYINTANLRANNLVIEDVRTGDNLVTSLGDAVKLVLASDPLPVETGKKYPATIETANTNLVTGKVNVEFRVIAHDLADARVENIDWLESGVTYTGSQITKGITKENFQTKVGVLRERNTGNVISANEEYSTTPEFGENLNAYTATNTDAGEGKIIINGIGTREGTQKVITFAINPRDLSKVNVPASVPFDASIEKAEDYGLAAQTTVTASFKDEWTGEKKTLTAPASDYDITYKWLDADGNERTTPVKGGYIQTTVTRKENVKSNFNFSATGFVATAKTKLTKRELTKENIILKKDTYTYTGEDAKVEYDVIYNGEKLVKEVDYTAVVVNGKHVGEGTLTITGKGDYEESPVSVKFNIVPAKTSDVKVVLANDIVYSGTKQDPKNVTLTLNGVKVNDDFKISYPTDKAANVNAGNGEIILTPVANAQKTLNFDTKGTATFTIKPATLNENGSIKAYNAKESLVKWYQSGVGQDTEFRFTFDGNAKSYTKTLYKAGTQDVATRVVTSDDYEIKYVDAVHGKMTFNPSDYGRGFALVVAKGNYVGKANVTVDGKEVVKDGVYTCEDGTKISNVVEAEAFLIQHLNFYKSNVTIENGQYKEGKNVDPVVTVNYNGKKLTKDIDFELKYTDGTDRTKVTNGKTLEVEIVGKGGYRAAETIKGNWGIDAFDLENAEVIVSGTDKDPVVKVLNSGVVVDTKEYTVDTTTEEGKAIITAAKDSKNYTGSKTVDIKVALDKPATPMLEKVVVNGNKATAILSGECEGAMGYDYVISKDKDCTTNKDYDQISKNILKTATDFTYVQQGTYFAYCHAWTRDENGKKVFSEWSNPYAFVVNAITPETPVITSVVRKGSTVTVTYENAEAADGYDVVLGSAVKTVAGEKRPVNYGTLVKKNQTKTTVVFKNVPAGTYYVGMHAYNRTNPENNTKVFSPWANYSKKVTVK